MVWNLLIQRVATQSFLDQRIMVLLGMIFSPISFSIPKLRSWSFLEHVISKRRMKKSIRRIMDDTELAEETKRKIAMEKVCDLSALYLYLMYSLV